MFTVLNKVGSVWQYLQEVRGTAIRCPLYNRRDSEDSDEIRRRDVSGTGEFCTSIIIGEI